jgi:hypothetical protein
MMADCGMGRPKKVICGQIRRALNEEGQYLKEQCDAIKAAGQRIDPKIEVFD